MQQKIAVLNFRTVNLSVYRNYKVKILEVYQNFLILHPENFSSTWFCSQSRKPFSVVWFVFRNLTVLRNSRQLSSRFLNLFVAWKTPQVNPARVNQKLAFLLRLGYILLNCKIVSKFGNFFDSRVLRPTLAWFAVERNTNAIIYYYITAKIADACLLICSLSGNHSKLVSRYEFANENK